MSSGAVDGGVDLKERELALTARVTVLQQQLCEALLERSGLRSSLGDRNGANEDAERARTMGYIDNYEVRSAGAAAR